MIIGLRPCAVSPYLPPYTLYHKFPATRYKLPATSDQEPAARDQYQYSYINHRRNGKIIPVNDLIVRFVPQDLFDAIGF